MKKHHSVAPDVKDAGMGVAGLTVTAVPIWNDADTASALTMLDDGMHGDDAPGDGLYGIQLSNLNSGVVEYRTSVTGATSAGQINRLLSFSAYVMGYRCGDADGSGNINIADAVYLVCYIFRNCATPDPVAAGDVDYDGSITIADVVYLVNYIFSGGPEPCAACK